MTTTNQTKFSKLLNTNAVYTRVCGVSIDKIDKIFKYRVCISPNTGFCGSINRYFKIYVNAVKFADSF